MMNKHIIIDRITIELAGLLSGKDKFFSASIESPSYIGHLVNISMNISEIRQEDIVEVQAQTLQGPVNIAYNIVQWKGAEYPTLIYHHGNNERPFDFRGTAKNTFYQIFLKGHQLPDFNLIVIRAAFHDEDLRSYRHKMTRLANFTVMLALSARLIEELIQRLQQQNAAIVVAGISLGGLAANLHRAYYNTARAYVPMLSGASPAETFLASSYRRLAGSLAIENPEVIRDKLNFDQDFAKIQQANLYPLLARYDEYIPYSLNKQVYFGHPLKLIDKGHITAAISADVLREHIMEVLHKF
jgi:hypothetical protein